MISEHMRRVRMGYLDIVPFVQRLHEARSPANGHWHAMYFMALDANPASPQPGLLCEFGDEECDCGPDRREGCIWSFPAKTREIPA